MSDKKSKPVTFDRLTDLPDAVMLFAAQIEPAQAGSNAAAW